MKAFLIFYLTVTAAMFFYVGGVCISKKHAPVAGTLGLMFGGLGVLLAGAVILEGI